MSVGRFKTIDQLGKRGRRDASGGTLVIGPEEIPGGDFIVIGIDPQGALFSLIGTRPAQS